MPATSADLVDRATAADIPRIVEMKFAMFVESGRGHLLPRNARTMICEDYESMYSTQLATHFLVRREGVVVACAGAFLKSDLPYRYYSPSMYGFIGDVYTVPAARGAGLALLLSNAALAWLQSKGVRSVRLLASEFARPMCAAMGFKPSDQMVLHFAVDSERLASTT